MEAHYVNGLARLAALQDSNESICIFRRYGDVFARILLAKEIELDKLVVKLRKLDEEDAENPALRYRLKSTHFPEGSDARQSELLQELEQKLKGYCWLQATLHVQRLS